MFIGNLKKQVTLKKALLALIWALLLLFAVAGLLYLVYLLFAFIARYMELLILCGSVVIIAIYYIKEKSNEKKQRKQQEKERAQEQQEEALTNSLERNYILLKQVLFTVINETLDITCLPKVQSLSQLDTPIHFVKTSGFHTYQYMVARTSSTVSLDMLATILRNRMEQKLLAGEVPGIAQTVYIHSSGQVYPIIYIDNITEAGNSFLQVNMVVASKPYAEFCERVRYTAPSNDSALVDTDF